MADTQAKLDGPPPFSEQDPLGAAVLEWWKRMQGWQGERLDALEETALQPGVAGERAELKRAGSDEEVVFSLAYQRLRRALIRAGSGENREAALIALARVLVRVKKPELKGSLPERMGKNEEDGDKPRVSELRFKRLLRAETPSELADALVRLLPMLDDSANPLELARDIWYWGERSPKRWANQYYQAYLSNSSNP